MTNKQKKRALRSAWSLLFLVPFVAVLWPPLYNATEPSWLGLPFFYWYQLAWLFITAGIAAVVYRATDS